jgi:sterol desaturase/sphingolipid hydroxylase (fatty acid hydroxylase superfamily)
MHAFNSLSAGVLAPNALAPQSRLMIIGLVLALMLLEYGIARLNRADTHDLKETAATFGVAVGRNFVRFLEAGLLAAPFIFLYQHRLFSFDQSSPWMLAVLFVAVEFLYYWQHRAFHRVRWFWASHAVHHSPTRMNFTAAIRLGWTSNLSGAFLFYLPLAWIGFHPLAIAAMLGLNLVYQFFIHTELVRSLGPLEWVLNTPAHHRVHHASNETCLDRNYGGALIVFDRLFGTFAAAPQGEPLRYGLVGKTVTLNPLQIALGEWGAMLRDVWDVRGGARGIRLMFGPPGAPLPVRQTSQPQ